MSMTTWRKELTAALADAGESWDSVVSHTLSDYQLDAEFDPGFGGTEGCAFTLWTHRNVYFPAQYDGSQWVAYISRDPNGVATHHIGG